MIDLEITTRDEESIPHERQGIASGLRWNLAAWRWVEAAIEAGLDPRLLQNPLQDRDAGEWQIATKKVPGLHELAPLPEGYFDEIVLILESLGRVTPDGVLKCWHGGVLIDDCSPRAIALRLRLARRCLKLIETDFFESWQVVPGLSADEPHAAHQLSHLLELAARQLGSKYGIPEEWLFSGTPEEIEL